MLSRDHRVLPAVSRRYPRPLGTFRHITTPFAAVPPCGVLARLACLIHAANVHSEPGSNPSLDCLKQSLSPVSFETHLKSLLESKFKIRRSDRYRSFLDTSETLGPPHQSPCGFQCFRSSEPITGVTGRLALNQTLQTIPTPAFSQLFYEHTDSLRNPPTRLPKIDRLFSDTQMPKHSPSFGCSYRADLAPRVARTFSITQHLARCGRLSHGPGRSLI